MTSENGSRNQEVFVSRMDQLNELVSLLPGGWPFALVALLTFIASIFASIQQLSRLMFFGG